MKAPRSGGQPRLLILNLYHVHPPDTGAKVVIWNRIVELSRYFEITFCYCDEAAQPLEEASLEALRRHCRVVQIRPQLRQSPIRAALDQFRNPAVRLFAEPVRAWLTDPAAAALSQEDFDLIELHSSCWYRHDLDGFRGIKVLVAHNDETEYWRGQAAATAGSTEGVLGARFDAFQARRQQARALAACDALVTLSGQDLEALRPLLGDKPSRADHGGIDCSFYERGAEATQDASTLVLVATFVDAVAAAARVFGDEVLPRLEADGRRVTLRLVGDHRNHPLLMPLRERPDVVLTGRVEDVRPELRRATAVVVPIDGGSGVRLKIMEACAAGKAIVTTEAGAAGLGLVNGRNALIVPTIESMRPAVQRVLDDLLLRQRLEDSARALAVTEFDHGPRLKRLAEWYLGLPDAF